MTVEIAVVAHKNILVTHNFAQLVEVVLVHLAQVLVGADIVHLVLAQVD